MVVRISDHVSTYLPSTSMTGLFNLFDWGFTTSVTSLFVGNVINLFLYGALTAQLYLYCTSFPQDSRLLKAVVYLIYATETVYTVLLIYDLKHFSMLLNNSTPYISAIAIPVAGGIVAFLTQGTYAYRLGILTRSKYVLWSIVAVIAANLVVNCILLPLVGFIPVLVWASVSLAIDIVIAVIMIRLLTKNEILSKQLKSKVTRLILLIIGTGTLTAAINLVTLILFALRSPAVYGPAILLSKLYANSMMVFLNDRILYGNDGDGQAISLEIVTGSFHHPIHFATTPGVTDSHTPQEQLALDGCNNARFSTPGRTVAKYSSKKHSYTM